MRALAAARADEDAVSLVPGSFDVGYVAENGSAHRVALTDARAVRFEATAPSPVTGAIASSVSAISWSVAPAASARGGCHFLILPPAAAGRMLAVWGAGDGRVVLPGRRRQRRGLHEAFPPRGTLMPPGRDGKPRRIPARAPAPPTGGGVTGEDLDLRPDDEHVRIHGKGGTVRTVLLDDRGYVALLRLYLARAGYTAGPLFRASINGSGGPLSYDAAHHRWEGYCAAAGVVMDIHQLRHAHATELINSGVSIEAVRRRLGHASTETTQLYALLDDKVADAEIRAAGRRRDRPAH